MPKFLIERNIPNAGDLNAQEMCDAARNSRDVLHSLGPEIQWLQSYVTVDRITCVYIAPDKKLPARAQQRRYDRDGQPVTRPLPAPRGSCAGSSPTASWGTAR